MYRERGWCSRCGETIYREEWRRPKLPDFTLKELTAEEMMLPTPYEIELFYKYFDRYGTEVVSCPRCHSIIR